MIEPLDVQQCQVEQRSFMTLGPGMHRCQNAPTRVVVEREPAKDGEHGAMTMCDPCFNVFKERHGDAHVLVFAIRKK